ncbi:MAG: DUF192 domain-containing protein [Solirubrobacterales bacterium]
MTIAYRFRVLKQTEILGTAVPVATNLLARLFGLAFMRRERARPGLFIPNCHSVHTFGMLFRLDIGFLDAKGRVIELRCDVPPGRIARCPEAVAVLEVPSP